MSTATEANVKRSGKVAVLHRHLSTAARKKLFDKSTGDELMNILEHGKIKTVFQPMISLKDGIIMGYEALSRGPADSHLENPTTLFDVARIYGKLWELELLCRIKALENIAVRESQVNIFLNVDPDIINDEKFKKGFTREFLKQFKINPDSIVFEITEKNSISNLESFKKVIDHYKEQGYKIAIDDVGSGYSGLKLITDIHPQYIKLDMNLIRDIDKNGIKHALLKTFYDFCLVTDIKLVAEGIETENELNTLIDMGIEYGQGFFIKRPSQDTGNINPGVREKILKRNRQKSRLYHSSPSSVKIGDVCRNNVTVSPASTGSKVLEIFNENQQIFGIPVVLDNTLKGLIMKDKFYAKLGTQYGFALFLNRPVALIMDKRPLSVDCNTTIDVVSKMAMARKDDKLYDYVIVTQDSRYYGIVTIKDLLEKTTEMEVNYATHLNPLSGLPGNIMIENRLKHYLADNGEFTVLYIDVDNFKVYNDIYGFENGDRFILFIARVLKESVASYCENESFIGHIGGDDFVVIVEGYDVSGLCEAIIDAFETGKNKFYNKHDLEKKIITTTNRRGEEEHYGIATISIAGTDNRKQKFKSVYDLSEHAGRVKKKCKETWSSCYLLK